MEIIQLLSKESIVACIIAATICYLVYFIRMVASYPRRPLPLPLIGHVSRKSHQDAYLASFIDIITDFRGKYDDPSPIFKMTEWADKFGPIYTLWIGHSPVVVVNNYELNTEASVQKRNDFINRGELVFRKLKHFSSC